MRLLVDLEEPQVRLLNELAKRERRPPESLIRWAIDEFLAKRHTGGQIEGFGLWGDRELDGLAYQEKTRAEW